MIDRAAVERGIARDDRSNKIALCLASSLCKYGVPMESGLWNSQERHLWSMQHVDMLSGTGP